MDVGVLAIFIFLAMTCISLDYWKRAPYMGVLGGIILFFLGVYLLQDGTMTTSYCVFNSTNSTIQCVDHELPVPSFFNTFYEGVGVMLMFLGIGVVLDTMFSWRRVVYERE